MVPPEPAVRYYETRTSPTRWVLGGALAALLVLGAAAFAWYEIGVFHTTAEERRELEASQLPTITGPDGEPIAVDEEPAAPLIEPTSVVIVGDSITRGATDAIRFTLAANGFTDIVIDGETSRRIESGNGRGTPLSGTRTVYGLIAEGATPDVWVVALGTNDVAKYKSDDEYREIIRIVADMLPESAPLVWVDVYRDDFADESARFNQLLRDELSDRPDTVVVPWSQTAIEFTDTLLRDGIHPTKDGNAEFAALVAGGIAELTAQRA
jgi:lysophospholipase L1-like esterase